MKKLIYLILIALLLNGCADAVNIKECINEAPYGFWSGLWHGLIIVFSWIGSLFSDDIAIYALNNNGGWYDFGFFIGIGGFSISVKRTTK